MTGIYNMEQRDCELVELDGVEVLVELADDSVLLIEVQKEEGETLVYTEVSLTG